MVDMSEYTELNHGVRANRPLVTIRRNFHQYRKMLTIAGFVAITLVFAGTVAMLVSTYTNDPDTPLPSTSQSVTPQNNQSMMAAQIMNGTLANCTNAQTCAWIQMYRLMNITWPRRDHQWYCRRWMKSRLKKVNMFRQSQEGDIIVSKARVARDVEDQNMKSRGFKLDLKYLYERGHNTNKSDDEKGDVMRSRPFQLDANIFAERGHFRNNSISTEDDEEDDDPYSDKWTTADGSTFASDDTFNWLRRATDMHGLSSMDVREAMQAGTDAEMSMREVEDRLVDGGHNLSRGSASHFHQRTFRKTSPHVKGMAQEAHRFLHATHFIKNRYNLSDEETTFDSRWMADLKGTTFCSKGTTEHGTKDYTLQYITNQSGEPPVRKKVHRECIGKELYRTADGSCNNLKYPKWGAAFTPYRRAMPPHYRDGVQSPRVSVTGWPLPPAGYVSRYVHTNTHAVSRSFTHLTMTWGQFVDHDITATAQTTGKNGSSITCCSVNVTSNSSLVHPECLPITHPSEDGSDSTTCMEFVRSAPAPTCSLGPREQLNQLTSFLDGSVIYGSTEEQQKSLRSFEDGKLKVQISVDGTQLPPPDTSNSSCNVEEQAHFNEFCFISGDARVNEQILLTGMHTILIRQHNSLAIQLKVLNPHWGDEKLFQESRRILSAQLQHITYNEYIPAILGPYLSRAVRLTPRKTGYNKDHYNSQLHPGIANEFAAAAYRFGHSQIRGLIQSVGGDGSEVKFRQIKNYYFRPFELYDPGRLAAHVRGQISQNAAAVDSYFSEQVTKHLFEPKDKAAHGAGLDLVAINIQRGRDHGVAPYTRWRRWCGLEPVHSFDDLSRFVDYNTLGRMRSVYSDVEDIDLYSGGLAEYPIRGGLVGPTFACILTDQFYRLKFGDRFWYETDEFPQGFTLDQLRELKKTSLAYLLCEQVEDLGGIQRWPFMVFSSNNPRLQCSSSSIPGVDLSPWEEDSL